MTTQVLTTLVLAGQSGILIQTVFSYHIISTHTDTAETKAKQSNALGLSLLVLVMLTFAVGNNCSYLWLISQSITRGDDGQFWSIFFLSLP